MDALGENYASDSEDDVIKVTKPKDEGKWKSIVQRNFLDTVKKGGSAVAPSTTSSSLMPPSMFLS